jgi:hypothetical protein
MPQAAASKRESAAGPGGSPRAEISFAASLLRRAVRRPPRPGAVPDNSSFFRAIKNFFQVSREELEGLRSTGMPPEEVAVALFISRRAGRRSLEVTRLRLAGAGWREILARFALAPEILHAPFAASAGPPLGPAGWREASLEAPRRLVLSDDDVVNLANLRLVWGCYGLTAGKAIALLSAGWTFADMHVGFRRPPPAAAARRAKAK